MKLEEKANKYITIFLLSQPIIDLITSIGLRFFDIDLSFGMITRFLFIMFGIVYVLFFSKSLDKKKSLIYIFIILIYGIIYMFNAFYLRGINVVYGESKALIKLFYFPVLLTVFWNVFDSNQFKSKTLIKVSYIYIIIILIAQFTGTAFVSYSGGKMGHVGWFFSPNEIGAIIAIMSPFIIWNLINNRKKFINYIYLFIYIYSTFIIGTKVPFVGMALSIFGIVIVYFIKVIFEKKQRKKNLFILVLPLVISLFIFIFMIPNTPAGYNLKIHLNWLKIENIEDLYKPNNKEELTNFVFSSRDKFLKETKDYYNTSSYSEKLLGIGYINQDGENMKSIERDYHEIFYRNGILGFILYFLLFFNIIIKIIKEGFSKIKKIINDIEIVSYILSLCLVISIAFFAGHVFVAPSVSIYITILILNLNYKLKKLE